MMFMYFWLNYCDESHVETILIAAKNINHLFHLASEIIEADRLHLFLLSDGTRIDDNEYLESIEKGTELIVCTEEQIRKLSIYFELKRYVSLKNISYSLKINYFFWRMAAFKQTNRVTAFLKNSFDKYLLSIFVETVLSITFYQVLFKVFFIVFT